MATRSSILAWKIPWTEEPAGYSPRDGKESDTTERLSMYAHSHCGGQSALREVYQLTC